MKTTRILMFCSWVLGLASAASAATLSITTDMPQNALGTYLPEFGQTYHLFIHGDAQGATSYGVFGRLEMNGALVDILEASQKLMAPGWNKGQLGIDNAGPIATVEVLNQTAIPPAGQTATDPIATVTLLARSFGFVNVTWNTTLGSGFELDYFGLTSAPGLSFLCCADAIIPEPSPHVLVGLGLLTLSAVRRVRSR